MRQEIASQKPLAMTDEEKVQMEEGIASRKRLAMTDEEKAPRMLVFMFGEAARTAEQGASERLLRWCRAYDEWLAERRAQQPSTVKPAVQAWRRLLQQSGKTPWELRQEDIEGHVAWMEAEGYSPATASCALGIFESFYRWCGERGVERNAGRASIRQRRPGGRRWGATGRRSC